jgi:NCS1 family nucleobase:cation symporter-1
MDKDTPRGPLFWYTFAGLAGSFLWVYSIGMLGAKSLGAQTAAGVQRLVGGGFVGELALVAIMFGAITSNAMNDYSGSLAVQAGGVRVKRHYSALVGTVISFFLILWLDTGNVSAKFQNVLLFTAYWIAPFLAIVLIDWRDRSAGVDRRTLVHMLEWKNLRSGWPALLSLVVGFGVMVPFMDTGLVVGPVSNALDGADLSFVVGFVVAAVVYYPLRVLSAHPAQPVPPTVLTGTTTPAPAPVTT